MAFNVPAYAARLAALLRLTARPLCKILALAVCVS